MHKSPFFALLFLAGAGVGATGLAGSNNVNNSSENANNGCPPANWTALDLDHDGYATKDEVKKAAPCIDFNAVDTNSDGSISRVEFLSFQEAKAQDTSAAKPQKTSDESTASQNQAQDKKGQEPARQQGKTSGGKIDQGQYDTPQALVMNVPKGKLRNPFKPDNKSIVKEGHQLFQNRGCSGCHGGGGGGGMGPPLTDQTWSYGDKPDTLYRLVTLGSKQLQEKYGYNRNTLQTMQADMPGLGASFDDTEDLWKIITWIESKHSKN